MEDILSFYNLITLLLAAIWVLIFLARPELRRELVILGVLSIFLMPLVFTINQVNATETQMGFANITFIDLLFAFTLSGIAGTLYHALFGKHYHKLPKPEKTKHHKDASISQLWIMRFFVAFLSFIWAVLLLHLIFELAIPTAFFLASVILAIYIVSHRHDLFADAIWSSFLTAFVVYLSTVLASTFTQTDFTIAPIVSGNLFLGAPLDLVLWAAAAGLALGPLYEFIRTLELK